MGFLQDLQHYGRKIGPEFNRKDIADKVSGLFSGK